MKPIIPKPVQCSEHPGIFHLVPQTVIVADQQNQGNAGFLRSLLGTSTGYPLPIQVPGNPSPNSITLHIAPDLALPGDEGYHLIVQPEGVTLEAQTAAGVFHAIQTLRQLLPVEIESRRLIPGRDWIIPCLEISDWPRFSWRGFMFDEGRHFHGMQTVKLLLDLMALQKLNRFHWHLTEDQGWRIEVRKYPRLADIGAWRSGTKPGFKGRSNGIPHGGFYTREDLQEIVAYAAQRHITIIPEIEIPGHSLAALASYPELSCTGGPFEVATGAGIYPDIYCAGKETTFTFLQDVLDEVLAIFPSPLIHIGGDEAPKKRWRACPDCQKRMRQLGLQDEHALQVYFTNRIAAYLRSKGRQIIGWNQIMEPGLDPGAVVQYWWGKVDELRRSIQNEGRQVIMSTYLDTYLDHSYSLMPLSRAYNYEPALPGQEEAGTGSILGLEFPLWTEWVPNRARLDYQAYPRLTAMAETGWSPKGSKDYKDFTHRLESFLKRLDSFQVRYAPLRDVEPSWFRRLFGTYTIAQPQTKIAS